MVSQFMCNSCFMFYFKIAQQENKEEVILITSSQVRQTLETQTTQHTKGRETSLLADRNRVREKLVVSLSKPGNMLVKGANPGSKEDRKREIFPRSETGLHIVCCNHGRQRKFLTYEFRHEGKKSLPGVSRAEKGSVFKTFVLNFSTQQMQYVFHMRYFTVEVQIPVFDIF